MAGLGLVDLHRLAVKVLVGKQLGSALEVQNSEPGLAEVFTQAGATANDLLEQRHGLDVLIQHDELAGLRVHAGAHELGGGGDDGIVLLWIDEVVQLALAFGVVTGDLHHVFGVGSAEVGIGVAQRLAHAGGVVDVFAKDDGLGVTVGGFEVLGDLGRHGFVALFQHQLAVHVGAGVDAVFNQVAVLVRHARRGAPAEGVFVQVHADDLVRCQVAVLNALLEAVGVEGRAKIVAVGNLLGFLGRGGQADLGGAAEISEDFAPRGVFVGAAAVALVHHDEVKEVGTELFVDVLFFVRAADGLVQRQINFVALVHQLGGPVHGQVHVFNLHLALVVDALNTLCIGAEFGHGALEGTEVVDHGLANQDVAVCHKQDALLAARLVRAPG